MGKKEDELEIAKFAAYTSGALKQVDSSKLNHGTGGPANKINLRSFISQPVQKPQKQINVPGMIEQPKARPLGTETVGTANVNVNELLIPTSGLDKETAEAMKKYMTAPVTVPSPTQPASTAVPGTEAKTTVTGVVVNKQAYESDLEKDINYIKRKLRAIEKNQNKIIEMIGSFINEK